MSFFSNKTLLITGGTGSFGTAALMLRGLDPRLLIRIIKNEE